jgi:hypothetical protein
MCVGYTINKTYSSHVDKEMVAPVRNNATSGMTQHYSFSACNTDHRGEKLEVK